MAHALPEPNRGASAAVEAAELPLITSCDGAERLTASILCERAPWMTTVVSPSGVPGMISDEERRYYEYVARFFAGLGEVVELGAWLGCSTFHIVAGLCRNPRFAGRQLHVFDAFIWHDYMDAHYQGDDRPPVGGSFRPLFDRFTAPLSFYLHVEARRIADETPNLHLPPLVWGRGPIELCYVDCGRTLEVNDAWYRVLAPHFIANRTLIVMQDWGTHKEVPQRWYDQSKLFTDAKVRSYSSSTSSHSGAQGRSCFALPENREVEDRVETIDAWALIDEIEYIPTHCRGANLFFQLVSRR